MVEGEFPVVDGPADQVLVVGVGGVEQCPVIDPGSFRADSAGAALPRIAAQPPGECVDLEAYSQPRGLVTLTQVRALVS